MLVPDHEGVADHLQQHRAVLAGKGVARLLAAGTTAMLGDKNPTCRPASSFLLSDVSFSRYLSSPSIGLPLSCSIFLSLSDSQ